MTPIQTELPMLRHAGAVIEYTVHEDDLEERDFPPIQDRTWGPIPPLAGSIDIGLLCRREPGPICFRASGNIATLFLPIGKARIVREGSDVTIVSYSIAVGLALEAAEKLAEDGIDAEVIDLRTLRPLDKETVLESLKKTNRMVVAEEGWPTCSISSEIVTICMEEGFDYLDAPVLRVTDEDVPLPYAANLEAMALIDSDRIVKAVKKVCYVE